MADTLTALTESARFEAVMARRPCARSLHFSLHHLGVQPACESKLSTDGFPVGPPPVDDLPAAPRILHLGMVIPKRHAKRSVTRNLVKRQVREQVRLHLGGLAAGDWVLRLRAPIDRKQFPSAASDALREVVREELLALLADAKRRQSVPAPAASPRAPVRSAAA